jgi:hypothetical protein
MKSNGILSARFATLRQATAAVDWLRNQAVHPDVISVDVLAPGLGARAPQRGDNLRADLRWIVSVDVDRAPLSARVAADALRREGGKLLRR